MTGHREKWIFAAILVTAVVIVYLPALSAGFIWDDDLHITKNQCVVGPLGFKEIWTTAEATYYPLVLTTFWLEHKLWGLAPLPYHLVNVLIHAACGLVLWRVLARLAVPGAWVGAALWALHPTQVESVAWVTELKNTQSCLFFLLAILCFLRWLDSRERSAYALALVLACAAILSKSSTVMLPVVQGLCWWWQEKSWRWKNAPALVPFFAVSAIASAWTIWEQKIHAGASGGDWALTWPARFIIAGRDLWFYLGKLTWPHPLMFIYPRWQPYPEQPLEYLPLLGALLIGVVLWWMRSGRARPYAFAFAYFVVSLFPVLGFFNVYYFRFSFVGDHLQYLASIGPLALVGAGVATVEGLVKRA